MQCNFPISCSIVSPRRVGFLETEIPVTAALPTTPAALTEKWDVIEKAPIAPTWDFMWNGTAEEGREKQLIQQAFTIRGNEIPATRAYPVESVYVADSALKVMIRCINLTALINRIHR